MTHFGTEDAATARASHLGQSSPTLVRAYLKIHTPAHIVDQGTMHDVETLVESLTGSMQFFDQLDDMGIDADEADDTLATLKRRRSFAPVVTLLSQWGFDGLTYENVVEDAGSQSWVIFKPAQVWRVGAASPDQ